jgi:hypothetical protein
MYSKNLCDCFMSLRCCRNYLTKYLPKLLNLEYTEVYTCRGRRGRAGREADRERGRQGESQTGRESDRERVKRGESQAGRESGGERDRRGERQAGRETGGERDRQGKRETGRERIPG